MFRELFVCYSSFWTEENAMFQAGVFSSVHSIPPGLSSILIAFTGPGEVRAIS